MNTLHDWFLFVQSGSCLRNKVICVNIDLGLRMFTHVYAYLRMFTCIVRKHKYVSAVFVRVYACLRNLRTRQLADGGPRRHCWMVLCWNLLGRKAPVDRVGLGVRWKRKREFGNCCWEEFNCYHDHGMRYADMQQVFG